MEKVIVYSTTSLKVKPAKKHTYYIVNYTGLPLSHDLNWYRTAQEATVELGKLTAIRTKVRSSRINKLGNELEVACCDPHNGKIHFKTMGGQYAGSGAPKGMELNPSGEVGLVYGTYISFLGVTEGVADLELTDAFNSKAVYVWQSAPNRLFQRIVDNNTDRQIIEEAS